MSFWVVGRRLGGRTFTVAEFAFAAAAFLILWRASCWGMCVRILARLFKENPNSCHRSVTRFVSKSQLSRKNDALCLYADNSPDESSINLYWRVIQDFWRCKWKLGVQLLLAWLAWACFERPEVELGHKARFSGACQRYSVASTRGPNSRELRLHRWQARVTTSELVGEKGKRNSVRKRGLRIAESLRERRKGLGEGGGKSCV